MYKHGEMPKKGLPDPKEVIFAFPETIWPEGQKKGEEKTVIELGHEVQFVDDGAGSDDCI